MASKSLGSILGGGGGAKSSSLKLAKAPKTTAAPAAKQTSLQKSAKSVASSRAKLAAAGQPDPTTTTEPTALDRIFVPLQAGQQVASSLIDELIKYGFKGNNLAFATNDQERKIGEWLFTDPSGKVVGGTSPGKVFLDALGGRRTIDGTQVVSDLNKRLGFKDDENPMVRGGAGFAWDMLTDPTTYASFGLTAAGKAAGREAAAKVAVEGVDHGGLLALGYTEKAATELISKYGDDAGRIAVDVLSKPAANDLYARVAVDAASNIKGGRGLLKQGGKVGDFIQRGMTRGSLAAKDLALNNVVGKQLSRMFVHGNATEAYQAANSLQRAGYDSLKRIAGAGLANADHVGAVAGEIVAKNVKDPRTRNILSIAVSRMFGDEKSLATLDRIATQIDNATNVAINATDDSVKEAAEAAKEMYKAELTAAVDNAYNPNVVAETLAKFDITDPAAVKEAQDAVEMVREHMHDLFARQKDAGVPVKDLFGRESAGYLPGMKATPRQGKTLKQVVTGAKSERQVYNDALEEVGKELGIDVTELRQPGKLGEFWRAMKPSKAKPKTYMNVEARLKGVERGTTKAVAKGGVSTETDIARLTAYATAKAEGRIALAEFANAVKKVAGHDKGAAELLLKAEESFTNDAATEGLLKIFDAATGVFKKQATVWRVPAFQIRNKLSNMWLMGLNDGIDTEMYGRSPFMLMGKDKGVVTGLKELGGDVGADDLQNIARQLGVIAGRGRDELYGNQTRVGLTKIGRDINTHLVEDADRLTVFVAGLRKGMTPKAAASFVDDTLFSYDASLLTSFEQNVMRRIMPFYIWRRRSLPHLGEALMRNPAYMGAAQKLAANMQQSFGVDDSIIPDYIRQSGYVPFQIPGQKNPNLLTLQGVLPVGDLATAIDPRGVLETAQGQLAQTNPYFIKDPLEILFNYDLFTRTPLEKSYLPGEKRKSPPIINTLDKLLGGAERPFIGAVEKVNPTTGETYIATNNRIFNKLVRDASPFMGQVGRVTSPRDNYDLTAALSGLRGYEYNVPQFQQQKTFEDQATLAALIATLKAQGVITTPPKKAAKKKKKSLGEVLGGSK